MERYERAIFCRMIYNVEEVVRGYNRLELANIVSGRDEVSPKVRGGKSDES